MDIKREILFRGKDLETGKWVYGYLVRVRYYLDEEKIRSIIIPVETALYPRGEIGCLAFVNPETVGQFTGLVDKNGTKIFEGDIIKCVTFGFSPDVFVTEVKFGPKGGALGFYLANGRNMFYFGQSDLTVMDDSRVIGNIHDNPELSKEAANE